MSDDAIKHLNQSLFTATVNVDNIGVGTGMGIEVLSSRY